jgi:hypothetical protein
MCPGFRQMLNNQLGVSLEALEKGREILDIINKRSLYLLY